MLWGTRNYGRAGELLQQALYAARSLDDPARVGRSLNQLGNWLMNTEQPFAALRLHEEALAIFRRLDNRAGMAETLDLLAIVHYNCGDLLAGHQCYEEAIPLWRALGDRQGLVHSLGGWSLRADFTLEYDSTPVDECIPYAEESMRLARSIEWRSGESLALICAGLVFVQAGRYNEALEYYTEALAIAREIEHPG
jgi:tetratricopeptide (TPR) repeat protein